MPFVHENLSFIEWAAIAVLVLAAIAAALAIFLNFKGVKRYLHIRRM